MIYIKILKVRWCNVFMIFSVLLLVIVWYGLFKNMLLVINSLFIVWIINRVSMIMINYFFRGLWFVIFGLFLLKSVCKYVMICFGLVINWEKCVYLGLIIF